MKISLASDHAGFDEKQKVAVYLESQGHEVLDRGPTDDKRVDYPDYAVLVAQDVADHAADFGVLVCGTGIGMAIAANKVAGIRAANITDPKFAVLAREHNDANIVTLSARLIDTATNQRILNTFLTTDFGKGRHADRVKKIMDLD